MLLGHQFRNVSLNRALEAFLGLAHDLLGDQLVSVLLHGSVVFDDLAPGYGDLDFVAIVACDVSEETCQRLVELRRPLRAGEHGVFGAMLEGAFLPRELLDPEKTGAAFWWGTGGERAWQRNQLGWFCLHALRTIGIVILGEDVRAEIPAASRDSLLRDAWVECQNIKEHGRGGTLHSVDWLLQAARLLFWLKEGELTSKSKAADWGLDHAKGRWRALLPQAKEIRLHPQLAESPEVKRWLEGLTEAIQKASQEAEQELLALGFRPPAA
jgi:predicted nucleotidyltransferase